MTQEILSTLQYAILQKFINVNIEKFDYVEFQELFSSVLNVTSRLLPDHYLTIDDITYNSKNNYILIKFSSTVNLLDGNLYILISINKFIITDLEVSIIY
jgi:hypothetical protein